jgi:hypothetical protein
MTAPRQRQRLPDRRASLTFDLESQGLKFTCSASRFADGSLAEVFLTNHKAGSAAGIMASDAAVLASIALQFGAPLDVLRGALMRDPQGRAISPLGVALDMIAADEGTQR